MSFRCTNCGATVDVPPDVLSTTCSFCDSPLVDIATGSEVPDRVVPFIVGPRRAGELLSKYLQTAWLAPERLRHSTRPSGLRALYVPFYSFDAIAHSRWSARIGIEWERPETYQETDGDGNTVTRTRTVTETEWFDLTGRHGKRWRDHLVSASRGLPEVEANELEPFDLGRSEPFDAAWIAGHAAEHPTIDHATARSTARTELEDAEAREIARAFLPGDTHDDLSVRTEVDVQEVQLLLLPVWIAIAGKGEGAIRMLVNGQTGEVVATLPRSWVKIGMLVLLCLGCLLALLGIFSVAGVFE